MNQLNLCWSVVALCYIITLMSQDTAWSYSAGDDESDKSLLPYLP